jgi:hypothetical protein
MSRRGTGVTAVALAVLFNGALAAEPSRAQSQIVDGLDFHYGVVPAQLLRRYPGENPERKMHGGPNDTSHIVLALFDAVTGERITSARARAIVTPLGGAATSRRLEPMTIAGAASFGNFFRLSGPDSYRIRFEVDRPGQPRTSAEFEYRLPAR